MRRSARARLALLLLSVVPTGPPDVPQNAVHIVDEGYLLHIVVWLSPATYTEICQSYMRYIQTHCRMAATVVFNGYIAPPPLPRSQRRRSDEQPNAHMLILK